MEASIFVKAIFLRRLNRFVIECLKDSKNLRAYLPNPGRLWELLLPGRIIYLKKSQNGLPYTVWATERGGNIICLHTHYTNEVAKHIINKKFIPDLKDYVIKAREFRIGNHRVDFFLCNNSRTLPLEVKSCTLFNNSIAMFPDAITERGRRHLEILAGNNGAILFIVHNPDVMYFLPDFHTDPLFSEALARLRDRLLVKAISIKWFEDMTFNFIKELEIPWHVYDREARDKGSYILCGILSKDRTVKIGGLGRINFKKGYYLYTGSAMNSLSSRLRRHMRKHKTLKWHIDYLIPHLKDLRPIPIRSSESLECILSNELKRISGGYIPHFGSSDCSCESHLYWNKDNPFQDEKFIDIILRYRISRLKELI
ncbi:MAG: DNA/RNA nuclease SfsA [Thermodesulfovibrionales bacterium]